VPPHLAGRSSQAAGDATFRVLECTHRHLTTIRMSQTNAARVSALLEVACVVAAGLVAHAGLRSLQLGVGVSAFGVLVPLALATGLMWRRRSSWRDVGLRRPARLRGALLWGLGLFVVEILLLPMVVAPLSAALHVPPQDLRAFADLPGNTARYLWLLIPITWGTAAFGEEMLYRGYYFDRLVAVFGPSRIGTVAALLAQAALFALGHAYLGPRGMLNAGGIGLIAGCALLANGRNLWPLFLAHGLVDSFGITALYLGLAHG
jgi:uncharacterized protein